MSDEEIEKLFIVCIPKQFENDIAISRSVIKEKTFFLYVERNLAKKINPFLKKIDLETTLSSSQDFSFSIFSFDSDSEDMNVEIEEKLYDWKCFWKNYETWYI